MKWKGLVKVFDIYIFQFFTNLLIKWNVWMRIIGLKAIWLKLDKNLIK